MVYLVIRFAGWDRTLKGQMVDMTCFLMDPRLFWEVDDAEENKIAISLP